MLCIPRLQNNAGKHHNYLVNWQKMLTLYHIKFIYSLAAGPLFFFILNHCLITTIWGCHTTCPRLYGMRSLKRLGLNKTGLVRYYTTNIRTALTYACQAWTPLLSDILTNKIIQVERKALRVIYPDLSYTDAITECAIPSLAIFVQKQCIHYVGKIFNNPTHPLNQLITIRTQAEALGYHVPHVCHDAVLQSWSLAFSTSTRTFYNFFQYFIFYFFM